MLIKSCVTLEIKLSDATETIILVDDAVDETTIDIIENTKKPEVKVTIFSTNRCYIDARNIRRRKNFLGGFSYFETNEFKDRYLLIDGKMLVFNDEPA